MTTLGYVDDVKITKREIAQVQLVQAIELFVSEKFLPSITLAGAAEEILGSLIAMQGDTPAIKVSEAALTVVEQRIFHTKNRDSIDRSNGGWLRRLVWLRHHQIFHQGLL